MTDHSSEIGKATPMSKQTDSEFWICESSMKTVNVLNNKVNNVSIKPINES